MRRALLAVISTAVFAAGCVGPVCAIECANTTTLDIKDAAGNDVTEFSGVIASGSERYSVGCGGAAPADAGIVAADGGMQHVNNAICEGSRVTLVHTTFGADIRVELTSGTGSFNGVVTVVEEARQVGSGTCSTNCPVQRGTVVLQ